MRPTITNGYLGLAAFCLAFALLLTGAARAQDGWVKIATSSIDLKSGKQAIDLSDNVVRSHAVRVAVTAGQIDLTRLRIAYANGQVHFETRTATLAAAQATAPIDERAETMVVQAVTVSFAPSPRQATLEIWVQTQLPPPPTVVAARAEQEAVIASRKKAESDARARADQDKAASAQKSASPPPPPVVAPAPSGGAKPPTSMPSFGAPVPPPPPARPATVGAARPATPPPPAQPGPSAATSASANERYKPFPVLFATTRERDDDRTKNGRKLASFTGELDEKRTLTLGKSIVTIPVERAVGSIPRPEFDLIVTRIALRSEDPNRDFTIAAVDVLSQSDFAAEVTRMATDARAFKRQAFVFVHGYNVSFDDAIFRTAQIAYDLGFDGPAITFSWPARGGMWDYRHDLDTSTASRDGLRAFLELIARQTGVDAVNLVAHSMGNAPLVDVLGTNAEIARSGGSVPDLKLKEIVLAAPDVSRDNFIQFANKLKGVMKTPVTLYASQNDLAMQISRRFSSGIIRAGDVPTNGPLIVDGVETIDISDASLGMFSTNHTTFAEREQLVSDIRAMFTVDSHPPDTRSKTYRTQGEAPRRWWRFFKS